MQHLDEGTIHAWLDGALSPDEAAKAEAHVAECPQCASAVAEARGFIAASSRILTALDNVPRGVIPAGATKQRVNPVVWRIAATMLVVAAGTLVVVRNYGPNEYPTSSSASATRSVLSPERTPVADQAGSTARVAAPTLGVPKKGAPNRAPQIVFSGKAIAPDARSQASKVTAMSARSAPSMKDAESDVAMDAALTQEPLKVVATPRRLGARVTVYEVAPGDTVTLMESVPMQLSEVVVTGAGAQGSAQAAAKAPPSAPRSLATVRAPQAQTANAEHTITWIDSTTGSTLTLSGRMPEARLQEIRIRIERERAAAKKKP